MARKSALPARARKKAAVRENLKGVAFEIVDDLTTLEMNRPRGLAMTDDTKLILVDQIELLIHDVRGQKILLDSDLAALYGVPTKVLNQAVRRNLDRFPADFLFQLTRDESEALRSQFVTLKTGRGQHRKYLPYAFTEHGVIMAATILNSPRAVAVSVFVVRAFVKLRQLVRAHKDLAAKLDQLERKVGSHDEAIKQLVVAIRQLMSPPDPPKNRMGFHAIRESATEKSAPSDQTASLPPPKPRRRTDG
jgi:hypothetical protein